MQQAAGLLDEGEVHSPVLLSPDEAREIHEGVSAEDGAGDQAGDGFVGTSGCSFDYEPGKGCGSTG